MRPSRSTFLSAFLLALLAACGGGGGGGELTIITPSDPIPVPPGAQIWVAARDAVTGRFQTTLSGDVGSEFQFFGQGVDPLGGTVRYEWDFEFDQVFEAAVLDPSQNGQAPTHTYDTPGDKRVAMRVTGSEGVSLATVSLHVGPVAAYTPPTADLRAFTLAGGGRLEVQFRAEGTHPAGREVFDLIWDFDGDGKEDPFDADGVATRGNPNPRTIYPGQGAYAANVRIVDELGNESVSNVMVVVCGRVPKSPPSAAILRLPGETELQTASSPFLLVEPGDRLRLLAVGSDPDGTTGNGATVTWDFNGDGLFGDELLLPTEYRIDNNRLVTIPFVEKEMRVTVRITDDDPVDPLDPDSPRSSAVSSILLVSGTSTTTRPPALRVSAETLHAAVEPCVASQGFLARGIQFHAEALSADTFGVIRYEWDFGDADELDGGCETTSTLQDPIHAFPTAGLYQVRVTAIDSTDPDRLRSTVSLPVRVGRCGDPNGGEDMYSYILPDPIVMYHGAQGVPGVMRSWATPGMIPTEYKLLRFQGTAGGINCAFGNDGVDTDANDLTSMPLRQDRNPGTPGAAPNLLFPGLWESPFTISSGGIPPAETCCSFPYVFEVQIRVPGLRLTDVLGHVIVVHGCHYGRMFLIGSGNAWGGGLFVGIHARADIQLPSVYGVEILYADQVPTWQSVDPRSLQCPEGWTCETIKDQNGVEIGVRFVLQDPLVGSPIVPSSNPTMQGGQSFGLNFGTQSGRPRSVRVRLLDHKGTVIGQTNAQLQFQS